MLVGLLIGGLAGTAVTALADGASMGSAQHLATAALLSLTGLGCSWLWNRRAVALGAPSFWQAWGGRFRRGGWVIGGVAVLAMVAWAIETARAQLEWKKIEAQLKTRGEPLTFQELLWGQVSEDQNFARHPLMAGVMAFHETTNALGEPKFHWVGKRRVSELQDALRFPEAFPAERKAGPRLHRTGPDLEALATLLKSGTNRSVRTVYLPDSDQPRETNDLFHLPIPPASLPAARAVLHAMEGRRAILDQVTEATRRPHCRYDIRYDEGPNALLPHLAIHKAMAVRLRTRVAARVAAGDTPGAAEDIDTMLRLSELTGEDPTLIGYLVRVAIQTLAMSAFWDGTSQHAWSEAQLAAFQRRFESLKQRDGLIHAFRGERLFGKTCFELMRQGRLNPETLGSTDGGGFGEAVASQLIPDAWLLQNQAHHSRTLDRITATLQNSDSERGIAARGSVWETERIDASIFEGDGKGRFHPYRILTRMLLPALARVHMKADRMLTGCRLAMTVAALERHRLAADNYPESLDALVPRFLPSIPLDPMDGKPLRYRRNSDGSFTLYGIGPNHADDGGVFETKQGQDLDWVWPPNQATEERRLF